jgi:hypothetical protein
VKQKTGLKIGVLTFHRCINYGSYWQAKCLVEALQSLGHNATILHHNSGAVNIAEWKCAYLPTLPTPVPASDIPLYRKKIRLFFDAFGSLPLSKQFSITDPAEMEPYDVVVIGSDEVWNFSHPWYAGYPLFFGEGVRAERIISYAASFGNYPALLGMEQQWTESLYNFDMISVRDENSRALIQSSLNIEPEVVLDPCLQFPINVEERHHSNWQKPYLGLYGHNFSEIFKQEVRRWATKQQLPIISIGYRNDWADEQYIVAGPHDFAHFIKNAKAIATNFFHGCVFSLRYAKPFVCETSFYRSTKIEDLLNKIGGNQHLMTEESSSCAFDTCLGAPLDGGILKRIEKLRKRSTEFLKRGLNHKEQKVA